MEGLASLLKLFFEKGSWLAGIALVGVATAILRWFGFFEDVNKDALYATYLVSAVCGSVYLTGGVAALVEYFRDERKDKKKRDALRKKAVENFLNLPPSYRNSIIWMYVFDRRSISVDGSVDELEILAQQGYLDRDFPDEYHVVKTYTVPDEIWDKLRKVDREPLKRHLREDRPPWEDSGRI